MSAEVAILGMGCVLPHGADDAALDRVLRGVHVSEPWADDPRFAVGRVPDHALGEFALSCQADRSIAMALAAAGAALRGAGLTPQRAGVLERLERSRIACRFALSKGGLAGLCEMFAAVRRGSPLPGESLASLDPAAAARAIAARFDLRGSVGATVTACASGGHCLAAGRALIFDGRADAVVCGAADASLHAAVLASYDRLGLLAPIDGAGRPRCEPFSGEPHGFYVGEGAAAFVLASRELAGRLGVQPRAWLAGCAEGATASGLVTMPPEGADLAALMQAALDRAGVRPGEVDVIGLHATGTRDGDAGEFSALSKVFGGAALGARLLATKPLHGHLLGAACAAETALLVRSLETGRIPRTINTGALGRGPGGLGTSAWRMPAGGRLGVKLAAGFGGQVSAQVLRARSREGVRGAGR